MQEVASLQPVKFIWNWGWNLEPNFPPKLCTNIYATVSLRLSWVKMKASSLKESQNIHLGIFKFQPSDETGLVNTS